jgi:hypothetical protein
LVPEPEWIWIQIGLWSVDPQKKIKSEEISCFEVLDVLLRVLEVPPVVWKSFIKT